MTLYIFHRFIASSSSIYIKNERNYCVQGA
nr:MAG TPA: hypothetical protein [Caudoviricetes sp.]